MSSLGKIGASKIGAIAVAISCLGNSGSAEAASRRASFPLTLCGPDLSQFCRLHGDFSAVPFRYNLAIHPGCIKWAIVQTPYGPQRQRILVCG